MCQVPNSDVFNRIGGHRRREFSWTRDSEVVSRDLDLRYAEGTRRPEVKPWFIPHPVQAEDRDLVIWSMRGDR